MANFQIPRQARVVVAMKPETTAGTDIFGGTYVTGDVIPTIFDSMRFTQDPNEIENLMTAGNMGRAPSVLGPLTARLDFSMFLRGRGSAYGASARPEADLPLRGARLAATVDASSGTESVTYQPTDTEEVMTIYVVVDVPGGNALSAQMVGCIGTGRFGGRAGEMIRMDFTFMGALESRADISYVGGTLTTTPQFPTLKSAAFQIGSTNYAPRIAEISFDLGNRIIPIPSINSAQGVVGHTVIDRRPEFTIDPEADREANSGWWDALSDGDPMKDLSFQVGSVQYNRVKFRASADASPGPASTVQVVAQSFGARNGIMALPTRLLATIDSANNDFAITFD
ncbi:MAG TPA: phage tail tube protein [Methylomirabilota bacterium]